MGAPARLCRLCPRPKYYCVENCASCGFPHCQKHIVWANDRWLCRRCANKEAKVAT